MLTGIHLSGLCLLSRGGWWWRWLPQVALAGWQAIWSPYHLHWIVPHQAAASDGASHHVVDRDQMGAAFYFLFFQHKADFLANKSVSSSYCFSSCFLSSLAVIARLWGIWNMNVEANDISSFIPLALKMLCWDLKHWKYLHGLSF